MIKIYNTLTNIKESFKPITPNEVRMYVCGITVYDYCHIGHARMMVVFDIVYRHFKSRGYAVTYVRNITDIDDKIIQRALKNKESIKVLTERFTEAMHEDERNLNNLRPDLEPKATDNFPEIIDMISRLIESKHAYVADNDDVYYSISSFDGYGKLSGHKLDELRAGERVEIDSNKQDPLDFVLWKAAKINEPAWPSPWGNGRPGWHIECSAMAGKCLGSHFDIHGGGLDLKFPHHENEIAQSEAVNNEQFVNYWMHNGFVRIDDEKMSKSLDNFFTIREVLKKYKGEEIRFFMLGSHYRSPLNYSTQQLDNARAGLTRLYTALKNQPGIDKTVALTESYVKRFESAMDDDFNTPEALAVLFELASKLNKEQQATIKTALAVTLRSLGARLGILQTDSGQFLKASGSDEDSISQEEIYLLIEQRTQARTRGDFTEADRIRDLLLEQSIVLEDKQGKTDWRKTS